jgi:hypothetical protein
MNVADGRQLPSDSLSLPVALKNIRQDYVCVTSNRVLMVVGRGRGGYGIAWECDSGSGELKTYAEGIETILFKTSAFASPSP